VPNTLRSVPASSIRRSVTIKAGRLAAQIKKLGFEVETAR